MASATGLYKEVIVLSGQIVSLSASSVTLLSAPGVGMYYDINKIIMEYKRGTLDYSFSGDWIQIALASGAQGAFISASGLFNSGDDSIAIIPGLVRSISTADSLVQFLPHPINTPLYITTYNGTSPQGGNGYLIFKIWYDVRQLS